MRPHVVLGNLPCAPPMLVSKPRIFFLPDPAPFRNQERMLHQHSTGGRTMTKRYTAAVVETRNADASPLSMPLGRLRLVAAQALAESDRPAEARLGRNYLLE